MQESHDKGCFGAPNNTVSRHSALYDQGQVFCISVTFARPAQQFWLLGYDLRGAHPRSEHNSKLVLPQLNRLYEVLQ